MNSNFYCSTFLNDELKLFFRNQLTIVHYYKSSAHKNLTHYHKNYIYIFAYYHQLLNNMREQFNSIF